MTTTPSHLYYVETFEKRTFYVIPTKVGIQELIIRKVKQIPISMGMTKRDSRGLKIKEGTIHCAPTKL